MVSFKTIFESVLEYPNDQAKERFHNLIGLDDHKKRLIKTLSLIINPVILENWILKHHPKASHSLENILRRPPLILLAGDVGCGKTELATTIADEVAREQKIDVRLFSLSLSVRGQGNVGEMTKLISDAFTYIIEEAKKYNRNIKKASSAIILLVDEADALVQSRENEQMHHEDRAGVTAFMRGIDRLGNGNLPIAVIMCTNRLNNFDPAIKRRAAEILKFDRPTKEQRVAVLRSSFSGFDFSEEDIEQISLATGEKEGINYGVTYSDIRERLLQSIVYDAFPNKSINSIRALEIAKNLIPTPPFTEAQ